jgi:hypothetical protein
LRNSVFASTPAAGSILGPKPPGRRIASSNEPRTSRDFDTEAASRVSSCPVAGPGPTCGRGCRCTPGGRPVIRRSARRTSRPRASMPGPRRREPRPPHPSPLATAGRGRHRGRRPPPPSRRDWRSPVEIGDHPPMGGGHMGDEIPDGPIRARSGRRPAMGLDALDAQREPIGHSRITVGDLGRDGQGSAPASPERALSGQVDAGGEALRKGADPTSPPSPCPRPHRVPRPRGGDCGRGRTCVVGQRRGPCRVRSARPGHPWPVL